MKRIANPRRCRCSGGGRRAVRGTGVRRRSDQGLVPGRRRQQDAAARQERDGPDQRLDHQGRHARRAPARRTPPRARSTSPPAATGAAPTPRGWGSTSRRSSASPAIYSKGHYWEFFVNNHAASVGICDQKVKSGDQLLFATSRPRARPEFPIVIKRPRQGDRRHARSRSRRATTRPSPSKAKPLAGVSFTGVKGTTNAKGVATVTATKAGKLSLVGSKSGEIRSAAATVVRLQVALDGATPGPNRSRRRRRRARLRGLWVRARGRRQGRRRPGHRELRDPEARSGRSTRR